MGLIIVYEETKKGKLIQPHHFSNIKAAETASKTITSRGNVAKIQTMSKSYIYKPAKMPKPKRMPSSRMPRISNRIGKLK
jgi:hypothetical protein